MKKFKQVSRLVDIDLESNKENLISYMKEKNHLLLYETNDKDIVILALDQRDNLCIVSDFNLINFSEDIL